MKKRQIKKVNERAMHYLIRYDQNTFFNNFVKEWEDGGGDYDVPRGTWLYTYRDSYEYDEWDYIPCYLVLKNILFRKYSVCSYNEETGRNECHIRPDLKSPKKVFALADKMLENR